MGKSINIKNFYLAQVTESAGVLTYGDAVHIPGVMSATRTPQVARGTQYGDGVLVEEEIAKTAYNISINHNHIPQVWRAWMEGLIVAETGVESGTSADRPKPFAMGWEIEKTGGKREMVWFLYCKASPLEETTEQKTDNLTIGNDTIVITAFEHISLGRYYTKITSDNSSVTTQNFTDFLTQVQTTNTIAAPEPEE
jgi:phi13 family phage major tail protein